jgi:glycosyltransferase involved in cell wall biosynthesis
VHACAVATRQQLAPVGVLASSFEAVHPGSRFSVLVIDAGLGEGNDPAARYEVLTPAGIGVGDDELRRLALIHDAAGLSAALRPRFVTHLLARGQDDVVVHLAADAIVHGDLSPVEALARAHDVVLVPHLLRPAPRDGLLPDAGALVAGEPFTTAVIAVGRQATAFLHEWGDGLPLALVPTRHDHAVWRDPGVAVSPVNGHERSLTETSDGSILADGSPLRVLHLRGYDPARPHLLSDLGGTMPRVLLSDEPVLAALTADYGDRLQAARSAQGPPAPYRYGSICGTAIPSAVRALARDALDGTDPAGRPPLPFNPAGDVEFVRWLNEPVARRGDRVVTRMVIGVWRHRQDLQSSFPDPFLADLDGLVAWSETAADFRADYRNLHRSPAPVSAGAAEGAPASLPPPGLNIIGYLRAEAGVGEAGRLMALAADAAGIPYRTIATTDTPSRQLDPFVVGGTGSSRDEAEPYRVNLLCVNADRTPNLLAELPPALLDHRYRIALWFWELSRPASHTAAALDLVDEVWVASEFVAEPLRSLTAKPVLVTPLAIPPPAPTHLTRGDLALPTDRTVFLATFDAFSIPARKNPVGIIAAYTAAFGPDDGAHLVIKTINGARHRAALEQLWYLTRDRPDIEIRDGYLSRLEMSALVQLSDACVSLHRSEGFGLVPAAAMAAGKPVIATAYSGTLAFMDDDSALLVPYELADVGPGNDPYPADAQWAEPDLHTAAKHLRAVMEEPGAAHRLGEQARAAVARTHGPAVAGTWIDSRLNDITGAARRRRTSRGATP